MYCFFVPLQDKAWRGQKVRELSCPETNSNICQSVFRLPLHGLCLHVSLHWSPPQLSSGVGRAPLPASLRHQAERLQGLPRTRHREGEVACVPQDEEGSTRFTMFLISTKAWLSLAYFNHSASTIHIDTALILCPLSTHDENALLYRAALMH